MELTTGEIMMCIGGASFAVCTAVLIIASNVFRKERRKLAEKIESELNGE